MIFSRIPILALVGISVTNADTSTNGDATTMTTCNGQTLTLTSQPLTNSRDFLYCELVFNYPDGCGGDIYSTSPLAQCDLDWWDNLDLDAVAKELGADSVTKNGPQWWSMDEVTVKASEPVAINGTNMVFGANLPPGTMGSPMYTVFYPSKNQYLNWHAGKPTYRLTDADGYVYVMQGYKVAQEDLATLGDSFEDLPEGWEYSVVTPDEDLVFDLTTENPIPSIQDEFDQIYIRIPADEGGDTSEGKKIEPISLWAVTMLFAFHALFN